MTTKPTPFCCLPGCGKDAKFTIQTARVTSMGHPGVAGPDPYSDFTESCAEHVGSLLGHQPDAIDPGELYWLVTPLGLAVC